MMWWRHGITVGQVAGKKGQDLQINEDDFAEIRISMKQIEPGHNRG